MRAPPWLQTLDQRPSWLRKLSRAILAAPGGKNEKHIHWTGCEHEHLIYDVVPKTTQLTVLSKWQRLCQSSRGCTSRAKKPKRLLDLFLLGTGCFFYFYLLEACPILGPSRRCNATDFIIKMDVTSCAPWRKTSLMCTELAKTPLLSL